MLAAMFTRSLQNVETIDPIKSQSTYDSHAVHLLYEMPLDIDYNARPYKLKAGLCELPEVSPDGLDYTFRMTADAPVNAHDVKRSLDRLCDRTNASPGGWTVKNVKSVTVIDDKTLRVRLGRRQHVFPWLTAMSYFGVNRGGAITSSFSSAIRNGAAGRRCRRPKARAMTRYATSR